jgi:drug/metabolite transporter (DMT)-like permease
VIDGSNLAGLGLAACAAACFDGATVFQAMEARRFRGDSMRLSLLAKLIRRPRWLAAWALSAAGWPLQLWALSLAPLSLVQPTFALGILLLLALGSRILGERVGAGQVAAAAAIVAGVAGIALSAPENSDEYTTGPVLWIALGTLAAVALAPYVAGRSSRRAGGLLVIAAGAAFSASAIMSKLVVDELAAGRVGFALAWAAGAAAAAVAGLLGEMSGLQLRAAARVAPPIFVIETVVPVMLAPLVTSEDWGATPLGGAAIVASLLVVAAGGALIGRTRVVGELVASAETPTVP